MDSDAGHRDDDRLRYYARKLQRHPAYRAVQVALRSARQFVPQAFRLATSRYRKLPSAVIVGSQKAGTTQLYSYLLEHPRCFGGVAKELHYFSRYADRPLRWYQSQFPLARTVERVGFVRRQVIAPRRMRGDDREPYDLLRRGPLLQLGHHAAFVLRSYKRAGSARRCRRSRAYTECAPRPAAVGRWRERVAPRTLPGGSTVRTERRP